jgi:type I restriction enzyme R subunit
VVSHILKYHDTKTRQRRFNSILATASVGAAQIYWREFKNQQAALTDPESPDYNPLFRPLRIATIYSYSPNDADGSAEGDINSIDDETLESTEGLSTAAKDQLQESIDDYNKCFKTSFDSGKNFQDYYKDVSKRMKSHKEGGGDFPFQIDLLIVVNMFLTGFDAPTLNTLYVDKSLRLHGLLQAFSRTNRILNSEKSHGEILCFRPLEAQVDQSISLFGDEEALGIVLLRPYEEYLQEIKQHIGELQEMGSIAGLLRQSDKKQFIQIWGEILKHHNILKTFDEYPNTDQNRFLESVVQDNNSYYLELKDEYLEHKAGESILEDLVFETELVKSIEVNIDYILDLIEKYRNSSSQDQNLYSKLISSISASPTLRLKRELIEKFVAQLREEDSVDGQFSSFVEAEARKEAQEIAEEGGLDPVRLKRFINRSFKNGQLSTDGTSIVKLAKGQIGFGMKRKQWKMETVKVLTDYFEKYVDLVDAI